MSDVRSMVGEREAGGGRTAVEECGVVVLGDGDTELGLERIVGGGRGQVAALEEVERALDGDVGSFLSGKLVVLPRLQDRHRRVRSAEARGRRGTRGKGWLGRTFTAMSHDAATARPFS